MRSAIIGMLVLGLFCACRSNAQIGPFGKKLIEYGWDVPTPKAMRDNRTAMEKRPFEGIIYKLAGGYNAFVRKPLDPSSFAEDERILRALPFRRFKENFVLTFFHVSLVSHLLDEPDSASLARRLQADRWGLMPDFLIGMLAGASDRARFVDGNEVSYYYTGREPFFRAYHTIHERALNLVPAELREKYRRQVQAGQALNVDHVGWYQEFLNLPQFN